MEYLTQNSHYTKVLAGEFAGKIKPNKRAATVITLQGSLGAGKTTFVQGFAKAMRLKGHVTSPTFVIMKKYVLSRRKKFKHLWHLDCYRLKNSKHLRSLGWEGLLANPGNIILLEWPERVRRIIPKNSLNIKFKLGRKDQRIISTNR